jgi:hypothetical protein
MRFLTTQEYVPSDIRWRYAKKIQSLLAIERPQGDGNARTAHTISMVEDARQIWQRYVEVIKLEIRRGVTPQFNAFLEKLAGHAVRLAGAVHLLQHEDPHERPLDAQSMDAVSAWRTSSPSMPTWPLIGLFAKLAACKAHPGLDRA